MRDLITIPVNSSFSDMMKLIDLPSFPATARIYAGDVDITPDDEEGIDHLFVVNKSSELTVVIPPQDYVTIIVSLVLTIATTLILTPSVPNAATRKIPETSPNNGLSARTNKARVGARRPSIVGTVYSVPDLLALPYKVFNEAGRELEFNYMFVSEGTVTGSIFRDGSTQIKHITGSAVELYHPETSPGNGSPAVSVGTPITEPFIDARRSSSVNGQTLKPPNKIITSDNIKLQYPNNVIFENADDLLDKYDIGETMRISKAIIGGAAYSQVGTIVGSTIIYPNTALSDLPAHVTAGNQLIVTNEEFEHQELITTISSIQEISGTTSIVPTVFRASSNDSIAYKAFDGVADNYWINTAIDGTPCYLEVHYSTLVVLSSYTISRNFTAGASTNQYSPEDWKVMVSDDFGASWQDIDSKQGELIDKAVTSYTFNITPTQPFNRLRFVWNKANNAVAERISIGDISLNVSNPNPESKSVVININPALPEFVPTPDSNTSHFSEDEEVTTYTATELEISAGATLTNLGRPSEIESVTDNIITLVDPGWHSSINTDYEPREFSVEGIRWTDRFIIDDDEIEGVIVNLTCSNGAYKDDGKTQVRSIVECVIGLTSVDTNDNLIGSETLHPVTIKGSAIVRDSANKTGRVSKSGRVAVRMHRSSYKDEDFNGQVVDETKWKDLYSFKAITDHDIDNTRIRTETLAAEGALSLKERKLVIADATRLLPKYENGVMTSELYPTSNAADILVALTLDPFIGRGTLDKINLDQVYETADTIKAYFSNDTAADFNYTFDSSDLSFEDTFAIVAHAIFCRGYRRGLQLNLFFEKKQDTSTLLFCHRNKIPRSEKRKISFGITKNADGAISKYLDADGIERTISVPNDGLLNPLTIDLLGINEFQATKHAWRSWNKAIYQNTFTQFDATSEAALSVLGQRILVADNTTSTTYDGEVKNQNGLELELSQDVPATGYMHIQLPNAELQTIAYTRQEERKVKLSDQTRLVLSTSPQNYARATYMITEASEEDQAFILLERSGTKQFSMKLGNYDDRFYSNDKTL